MNAACKHATAKAGPFRHVWSASSIDKLSFTCSTHYSLQSVACHTVRSAEGRVFILCGMLQTPGLKLGMCWGAASAVWTSIPPAPAASSTGAQSTVPEPAAGRVALGCPAGPDYTWTGSTRSLLPELRPGQSAEVPLEVCSCVKAACFMIGHRHVAYCCLSGEAWRSWAAWQAWHPHGEAACMLSCPSCDRHSVSSVSTCIRTSPALLA